MFEPPRSPAEFRIVVTMLCGFVVLAALCLGGIVYFAKIRKRWNRMTRRGRWVAAAGVFAAVGLTHAAYGVFLATTV